MKVFRYKKGHVAGKTMTVGELRALLATHPDDMPVFAEWESCHAYAEPEMFSVKSVHKGMVADACDCLVVDVSSY